MWIYFRHGRSKSNENLRRESLRNRQGVARRISPARDYGHIQTERATVDGAAGRRARPPRSRPLPDVRVHSPYSPRIRTMRDMAKRRAANRRYAQSARGRAKQREHEKRYNRSVKGLIRCRKYEQSFKSVLKHDRYLDKRREAIFWCFESHTTTETDLEYLLGRSLDSDEKDWWTIVKWTGSDKFLSPNICLKSPSSSCSWRYLPA
jgi:hypothetical protein